MKSIRNKLSLATCSLLTTGNAAAEAIENAWEVDSSYLYYSEEERVTVNKLIGSAKGYVSPKNTASIKVVFDAMSGATPTGAVKNANPLTSTGASGGTGIGGSTAAAPLADVVHGGILRDGYNPRVQTLGVVKSPQQAAVLGEQPCEHLMRDVVDVGLQERWQRHARQLHAHGAPNQVQVCVAELCLGPVVTRDTCGDDGGCLLRRGHGGPRR